MVDEKWLPVDGFKGYEVSNLGNVRSYWGFGTQGLRSEPRLMRPVKRAQGYLWVNLGRGRQRAVHSLVTAAFLGARPADKECRHLDGNKLNCQLSNLAHGTRSENFDDRRRHGTLERRPRARDTAPRLRPEDVARIRSTNISGVVLAKELGVSCHTVYAVRNRKTWKHLP